MRHRPAIVLLSALVDLLVIGAIVIASGMAPDVLPVPHRLLAAPIERVVQLPDIPLPPAPRVAATPSTTVAPPQVSLAPVEPPATLPEPGAEHSTGSSLGVPGGNDDVTTVERGNGLVDGNAFPRVEPPTPPNPPVRLHSGIDAPRKLRDVSPVYPAAARAAGIRGVVILEVTISEQGAVTNARVLRSVPGLDQAALDAVTQWRFAPARLNGQSIPVVMTVTVNFALMR